MDEQKTLTLDFIKSLMEPAYTLIWTDYNDNLDNHCGLIQKCLDSKSREHLWEKADEWYSDAEWEAVREIIAKLKEECAVFHDFDGEAVDDFFDEYEDEIRDEIYSRNDSDVDHKGQEQQDAQGKQTADASPRLPAAVFRYSLFYYRNTLFCIVHTRKTSSLKTQLKKPFTYIGTKTQKNSHPKIKFFQKNLRAAQRQLPKEKNLFHYGVRRRASDFPAVRISPGRR